MIMKLITSILIFSLQISIISINCYGITDETRNTITTSLRHLLTSNKQQQPLMNSATVKNEKTGGKKKTKSLAALVKGKTRKPNPEPIVLDPKQQPQKDKIEPNTKDPQLIPNSYTLDNDIKKSINYLHIKISIDDEFDSTILDAFVDIPRLESKKMHFFLATADETDSKHNIQIESKLCYSDKSYNTYSFKFKNGLNLINGVQNKDATHNCQLFSNNKLKMTAQQNKNTASISSSIEFQENTKDYLPLLIKLSMEFTWFPDFIQVSNDMWIDNLRLPIEKQMQGRNIVINRKSLEVSHIIKTLKELSIFQNFPAFPHVEFMNEEGEDMGALTQNFFETIMDTLPSLITNKHGIINKHIDKETQTLFAKVIVLCLFMDGRSKRLYQYHCDITENILNPLYLKLALMPKDITASSIGTAFTLTDIEEIDVFDSDMKMFMTETNNCREVHSHTLIRNIRLIQSIAPYKLNFYPKTQKQLFNWHRECELAVTHHVYLDKFKSFSTILGKLLGDVSVTYVDGYSSCGIQNAVYSKNHFIDFDELKNVIGTMDIWIGYIFLPVESIKRKRYPKYHAWLLEWLNDNKDNQENLKAFLEFWTGSNKRVPKLQDKFKIKHSDRGKLPEAHQCEKTIDFYLYDNAAMFKEKLNQAIQLSPQRFDLL